MRDVGIVAGRPPGHCQHPRAFRSWRPKVRPHGEIVQVKLHSWDEDPKTGTTKGLRAATDLKKFRHMPCSIDSTRMKATKA